MKTKSKRSLGLFLVFLPLLGTSLLCLYMSQPTRLNSTGLWSFGMLWFGVAVIGLGCGVHYWRRGADRRV